MYRHSLNPGFDLGLQQLDAGNGVDSLALQEEELSLLKTPNLEPDDINLVCTAKEYFHGIQAGATCHSS